MTTEPSSKFFTIKPVESKGLGVTSKISIYRGTLILAESPLFTIPLERFSDSEEIIQEVLTTKSTPEHTEFKALHNAHSDEGLTGIFKTNSLPCGDNDLNLESQPATEHGVFLIGSRFNSSCTPNVNVFWNFESEEMEFRVMREIKAGEELCIAYCDILKTREERRKILKQRWGFDCHCPGCDLKFTKDYDATDEKEMVRISDMRRTCVGGLLRTVAFGYNVDSTKLALRLLKQEGILNFQETLSYDAYQLSTSGDQLEPRESLAWAKKAWKASCILTGINSPNSQRLLACYEDVMMRNQEQSSKWDEDLDSEALDELIEDEDDDGYYSD